MHIWHGLMVVLRRLFRAPLFALLSIAVQVFGIAITVSVGVLFHALFQTHPIRDISGVVDIQRVRPPNNALSVLDVEYLQAHQEAFSELLPWSPSWEFLFVHGESELIPIETVAYNYFDFVGHKVTIGRGLLPEDDRPGAPPVAVISHALWRRAFGGDLGVLGRSVTLGDHVLQVVGVAPASFRGIASPNTAPTVLWVSLATGQILRPRDQSVDEQLGSLQLKARLKAGASIEDARTQVNFLAREMDRERPPQPEAIAEPYAVRRLYRLRPADEVRIGERDDVVGRPLGWLAVVATVAVFLVVCVNLAILTIARRNGRRQEAAIRLTLGASPTGLFGAHVLESAMLGLIGGIGGWVASTLLLNRLVDAARRWPGFSQDFAVADGTLFSRLLLAATVTCFAVIASSPVSSFRRDRMARVLSMNASVGGSTSIHLQRTLVAAQIALSFMFVTVAVVCGKQVALAATHDSGIDLDRLAVVQPDFWYRAFGPSPLSPLRVRETCEQILSHVRNLPGVETAALSSGLPFGPTSQVHGWITVPERPFMPGLSPGGQSAVLLVSTPDVFRTLGVALLHGRLFDRSDADGTQPVVVVTELTASRVFGTRNPVGRRLVLLRQQWPGEPTAKPQEFYVAGVVRDMDVFAFGHRSDGVVFLPFSQNYSVGMTVLARAADPTQIVGAMRTAVRRADAQVGVFWAGTGRAVGGAEDLLLTGTTQVAAMLGVAAVLFSMGGLGGVLWTMVARRRHEIAVRVALGASPGVVARIIARDGLKPVFVGTTAGILLSSITSLTLRPMFLRFIPAVDPVVVGLVSLFIVLVAMVTSYVPASRAAAESPVSALKEV